MLSRILPISMANSVAFSALAPARKVVVSGERACQLTTHIIARAVCERKRVRIICGDNRFDPYAVARIAKLKRVRPEDALRSILIARAFTAYQMSELVSRLDPVNSGDVVIITGPCSTFFDEDVSLVDSARLFYRMLWQIVELAREGMTLLLAQSQLPATGRAYYLKDLCYASDVVLNCDGVHTFRLERRGRVALPRLAAVDRMIGD
jgi:hypothetical protein